MSLRRLQCALLCGVAGTLWAGAGAAQTITPGAQSPTQQASSNAQPATTTPGGLAGASPSTNTVTEVVVTANRRSESIQNVPSEVTAVTAADLSRIDAHSFGDFAAFVPGLSFSATPATSLIAIRGVTTGSQLSSAIGLYLDDIPLGASTSFGLGSNSFNVNAYDLNRVEVLNGPQGTLYGATSLGGTIKYVTAVPDLHQYSAEAEAEVSSTEHGGLNDGFRGSVNLPLGNGLAAVRIDGIDEYQSGYTSDPVHDRSDQGWARTTGGRISLYVKPTDDLDARFTYFMQRVPSNGLDVEFRDPTTRQPTIGAYEQDYPSEQPAVSSVTLYSGVVNYNLPWAKLTSITGYQDDHGASRTDQSLIYDTVLGGLGAGADPFSLYVNTTTKKFTEEFRIASHDNEHFQWIVGGYYDFERTKELVNLYDLANPGGALFGLPAFLSVLPSTYREYAAYGDGDVFVTRRFDIGFGVRYSQQHQIYEETISGLLATGSAAVSSPAPATSSQSVTTYSVNPRYHITDDTMVYFRAASGFRPGGPNFVLAPGLGNPTFAPDTLWNYEAGEKSTLLNKKLTLDFDIYDIEWKKIQITVNNGGVNQLENAGNARVQGAEMAFNYRVIPQLALGGSASYTDAHLDTTAPVIGVTYVGARLPLSPRYNFALVGTYNFNITDVYSGALTLTDRYEGNRDSGFGTAISPNYKLAAFNTVDADLALNGPYGVSALVYVKNLLDTAGELSAVTGANEYGPSLPVPVGLSLPRTVGITLKYRFE
jgi:outer membrane receptor protein involved in Fe transport